MPIIYFREKHEWEPYKTFIKEFERVRREQGLNGTILKIDDKKIPHIYVAGCKENVKFEFKFIKNEQARNLKEAFLIRHFMMISFDENYSELQRIALSEIKRHANYFYIEGAEYIVFSYDISFSTAKIYFDVISSEDSIKSICMQLMSHDIAIFSRS